MQPTQLQANLKNIEQVQLVNKVNFLSKTLCGKESTHVVFKLRLWDFEQNAWFTTAYLVGFLTAMEASESKNVSVRLTMRDDFAAKNGEIPDEEQHLRVIQDDQSDQSLNAVNNLSLMDLGKFMELQIECRDEQKRAECNTVIADLTSRGKQQVNINNKSQVFSGQMAKELNKASDGDGFDDEKNRVNRRRQFANQTARQVDFYFGDRNYFKDKYLTQVAEKDDQNWVDLAVLRQFNKMKVLIQGLEEDDIL